MLNLCWVFNENLYNQYNIDDHPHRCECRVYSTLDKCDSGATLASCKKAIDESVSMVWTSKDTHRQGLISADNIVWKDTELDKLRRRPFSVTGM